MGRDTSLNGPTGMAIGGQKYYENIQLEFQIDLVGHGSRVKMNGLELANVRDIKVHQPLEGGPIVTIEFLASKVSGWTNG